MENILTLIIAGASAVVAVLAWVESRRMRVTQDRDFNFQRSADLRIDDFKYFADRDLPRGTEAYDELRFTVRNVGRAFATEIEFAVDNRGLLSFVQAGLGLPPGSRRYDRVIKLSPLPDLSDREILLRYRYDDFRRHWGEVRLRVEDGSNQRYGDYRRPHIETARLDRRVNTSLADSDVFTTPMWEPRWWDPLTLPLRRKKFRRDHPECFHREN